MLSKLCRPSHSRTVVEVIKHGWLPRHPSLYYIDMEYCPETLEGRIHPPRAIQKLNGSGSTSTLDRSSDQDGDFLYTRATQYPPIDPPNSNTPNEFDWQSIVNIIEDITRGLIYLHNNKTIHRDLKPKNGTLLAGVL